MGVRYLLVVLLALAASACTGALSVPGGEASSSGATGGVATGVGGNGVIGSAGNGVIGSAGGVTNATGGSGGGGPGTNPTDPRLEARVWRLTPAQYNGEVQRFFPGAPVVDLPVGGSEYGLTNIAAQARIDTGNASQFTDAARSIGEWVSAQGATAARCTTFGTSECVDTFLDWFLPAAYRRPPTTDERTEIRGVYDDLVGPYGAAWAFSAVVRTVLLSPQFLYRTEIGPDGTTGIVAIDDYEIASLISFSLLDRGPDQQLLDDAQGAKLHDPNVREQEARRLMDSTTSLWERFFWEWLKMSTLQSQGIETGLDTALIADLEQEYRAFVDNIVVTNRGTLSDLLTSTRTWGTPDVATYYGSTHPGTGVAAFDLPTQRGGLLTLGAWLVSHGKLGRDNVVRRGMGVYRDAMCQDIKPLNIDLQAAQMQLVGADATVKQIAEARGSNPTCGACHATSDPVGLAFENFAGDGRYQTTYTDGKPVESQVVWKGVQYDTAPQISAAIAQDEVFQRCLVQRFGHFLLGADFGSPVTVRASGAAYDAFKNSNGSLGELLVAIVRDPTFIERRK